MSGGPKWPEPIDLTRKEDWYLMPKKIIIIKNKIHPIFTLHAFQRRHFIPHDLVLLNEGVWYHYAVCPVGFLVSV